MHKLSFTHRSSAFWSQFQTIRQRYIIKVENIVFVLISWIQSPFSLDECEACIWWSFSLWACERAGRELSSLAVDSRRFESGKVMGPAAKCNKNKLEALAHMWGNTGFGRWQFVCVNDGGWGKTFMALIGHTCPGRSSRTNALRFLLVWQPSASRKLNASTRGSRNMRIQTICQQDSCIIRQYKHLVRKYNIRPCVQYHTVHPCWLKR